MIRKFHRYLSLTLAFVWILQAVSGTVNVFHREIDAWSLDHDATTLNFEHFANGIEALRQSRLPARLSSIYATGGDPGQFDVFLHTVSDGLHVLRVDATGRVLRERPWSIDFQEAGFLQSVRLMHESLFLHDWGLFFVGLSGLMLLSNLILGVKLAWPKAGRWRAALFVRKHYPPAMKLRAWHRAMGLWFALPALVLVASGILLAWDGAVESVFGDATPEPQLAPLADSPDGWGDTSLGTAIALSREQYPGASLSIVSMPTKESPWFRIQLLQMQELGRVFGKTTVYVRASGAKILTQFDATKMSPGRKFLNSIYAIHSGEAGGITTRFIALLVGLWLTLMIGLGLSYWFARSRIGTAAMGARK